MRKLFEGLKSQPDDFAVLWVSASTIMSPIAIFAGLVATYFVVPSDDLVPEVPEPELISIIIVRSIAFALVAGAIFEIPRWLMLRRFAKLSFWIPATISSLAIGWLIVYFFQSTFLPVVELSGPTFQTNCLSSLPGLLLALWPLVLTGIAQSVVLKKNNVKWLTWLFAGSTSYLFPLAGFMACTRSGFFIGSFIAALLTLLALPITMEKKQ